MIIFSCKKLYGTKVSVPDYLVKYAKKANQVIEIDYEGKRMRINGNTRYTTNGYPHIALHTNKHIKSGGIYRLFDYEWNPMAPQPTGYTNEGLEALHGAMEKLFRK